MPVHAREGEWALAELSEYQTIKKLKFYISFTISVENPLKIMHQRIE